MFLTGAHSEDGICFSGNVTVIFGHTPRESQGLGAGSSFISLRGID